MQKTTTTRKKKACCEEREWSARKSESWSPTHEKPSQLLKPWVRQRFCERISELQGCVNLLNYHTAILDSVLKMMPFDADVFWGRVQVRLREVSLMCSNQLSSQAWQMQKKKKNCSAEKKRKAFGEKREKHHHLQICHSRQVRERLQLCNVRKNVPNVRKNVPMLASSLDCVSECIKT